VTTATACPSATDHACPHTTHAHAPPVGVAYIYEQSSITAYHIHHIHYTSFLKLSVTQSWNRTGNLIVRPLRVCITTVGAGDGNGGDDVDDDGSDVMDDGDDASSSIVPGEGPLWF